MKRCPSCNRTYTDVSLNFCLEDGTPLISDAPSPSDRATVRYSGPRDTAEPPPTEIYRPEVSPVNQGPAVARPQQWTPMPQTEPRKKSNAVWWILGGVLVVGVIGVGLIIMIIALASIGSSVDENNNRANMNRPVVNRNTNTNTGNANSTIANSNSNKPPSSLTDNFSEQKWGVSNSKFGDIWYNNDEYHMRSKKDTYLVMYAPTNDYNTENATVRVTARSVDGTSPSAGFGLIVHGEQSKTKGLEDYALLIYPSDQPAYEVVMHKDGNQSTLVSRTQTKVIRPGTNTNELEVRIKGSELSFYINGQYVNRISDTANFKRGLAGFYTSDTTEVAFDDLAITR